MLRHYNNISPPTLLSVGVDAVETTLTVGSTSDFPEVPFVLSIERGTANEEAVLVTAKDATTFTVIRGYDGTAAASHLSGSLLEHVAIALDYRESVVARISETDRDALAGDELFDGRVIYNTDDDEMEFRSPFGWEAFMPVGAVIPYAGAAAPAGWLLCDGAAVDRTTYAALFGIVGTTFGAGDGSTTFNVPDLRQRFPLGLAAAGTGSVLGETGGAIDHVHTNPATASAGSHTHTNPTTSSNGDHSHTQGSTSSAGSHAHLVGNTSSESGHTHTQGDTGAVANHSHTNSSTSTTGSHNHGGTGGPSSTVARPGSPAEVAVPSQTHTHTIGSSGSHSHTLSSTGSTGGHSHTNPTTSAGSAHSHTVSPTDTKGDHTHTNPSTSTTGAHTHTQGATGSDGDHTHTQGDTGVANPPFLALNYLIRV